MATLNIPLISDLGGLTGSGGTFATFSGRAGLLLAPFDYVASVPPIDMSGNWSLSAYVRSVSFSQNSYLSLSFAGTDRVLSKNLGTNFFDWTRIIIIQRLVGSVPDLSISLDGVALETNAVYPDGWGTPIGFAIYNDDALAGVGNVHLSDVTFAYSPLLQAQLIGEVTYDILRQAQFIGEVTYDLIVTAPPPPAVFGGSVKYLINNQLFSHFGVVVSKSKGVLSFPERKAPVSVSWPLSHGEVVDLRKPRFEARQITLNCLMVASSPADMENKFAAFCSEVYRSGTSRLQINVFDHSPLLFEVYSVGGIDLDKSPGWRNGKMFATFELTFREPQPIKRLFSFTGPGSAQVSFLNKEAVNIHWGDSTHDYDIFGMGDPISHSYSATGKYYVIVAGAIESMAGLITNMTEL